MIDLIKPICHKQGGYNMIYFVQFSSSKLHDSSRPQSCSLAFAFWNNTMPKCLESLVQFSYQIIGMRRTGMLN